MPNKTMQQVLHEIERAISEIQFGSVEITLHEGRVTQIERREKMRLTTDKPANFARSAKAV